MIRALLLAILLLPSVAFSQDAASDLGTGTAVTCSTTATAANDTSVADSNRYVQICNPSDATVTVYVGDESVTSSTGVPVAPGKCWSSGVRLTSDAVPYCIVASRTQSVRVQEAR